MKFRRLRLTGFKSFVEPAEIEIEDGLTGVVGPNGCGKSNLARGPALGDGRKLAQEHARLGHGRRHLLRHRHPPRPQPRRGHHHPRQCGRLAPVGFNDSDAIEVARRIDRERGSTYRINGREARARDVQLLFADASTGARSPALVRQGQIGEIINAPPQARRRILEEAAGITGPTPVATMPS